MLWLNDRIPDANNVKNLDDLKTCRIRLLEVSKQRFHDYLRLRKEFLQHCFIKLLYLLVECLKLYR